ncbi:ymr244c-a-like protein [Protomyces lactucae-debilis]|uniref:Ymr244c-a-like protein n=1 Tax=Protomyces lactucae-debilis TaxID=2754530 RepID=A0A1Y2F1C0_PROLT|nr:ymr244c-a-like protein [Protomyces lactucae-debilis]ORY77682.1 ymr244c-a-like protein [Protomyces lactucae-debilis]
MDRASRERCWSGRDAFFACLDANGIVDPLKKKQETDTHCKPEKTRFEDGCVATWVEYFCKKRVLEIQRENMIKQAQADGAVLLTKDDVRHPGGRGDST